MDEELLGMRLQGSFDLLGISRLISHLIGHKAMQCTLYGTVPNMTNLKASFIFLTGCLRMRRNLGASYSQVVALCM